MELGFVGGIGSGRSGWLAAMGAILFFTSSVYSQNLVQNGNFDSGDGSSENWQISHSLPSANYSGPTIASPGFGSNPYYARFDFEPGGGSDTLSQEIATTPGAVYDISFWAEDGAGNNFGAEFNFGTYSANLINAFAIGPGKWYSGWKDFNFDVTATELQIELSFVIAADSGSEFGVDNINVVPLPDFEAVAVGSNFEVTVSSPAYATVIQSSTNFINWVCVCTNMPPFTYTDCMSQFPRRFYRAAILVKQSQ